MAGRVSEVIVMGGTTSLAVSVDQVGETLRFDVSTHAARRGALARGVQVRLALLAEGIHLLPEAPKEMTT